MLTYLEIQNIAIIDKVSIEFGKGFNILTGETGAGKSIIIGSINAILGERISKDMIRTGRESAIITAMFCINTKEIQDIMDKFGINSENDGTLVISREFNISGKNICRVNGRIVTVTVLKELGEYLINVHGQNDNKALLNTEKHVELLDLFCGKEIEKLKNKYAEKISVLKQKRESLIKIAGDIGQRERRIDLLNYQINEIRDSELKDGEEEELKNKKLILANAEKIKRVHCQCYEIFTGEQGGFSIQDALSESMNLINSISSLDTKYEKISQDLSNVIYQIEDIIESVRNERDDMFYDEGLSENIDERIDLIFRLKRKYGETIKEILLYQDECEKELNELINSEEYIKELNLDIKNLNDELFELASKINKLRARSAIILEKNICAELQELEMKDSKFKVSIKFNDEQDIDGIYKFKDNGLDKVEFLISANKGEKVKALSKIASGGEMSRIMLAIKTILSNGDNIESLIFDEIDTGISGRAAQKVGEKLAVLSKNHQVICITHLSQIAAMADNHYMIEKNIQNNTTKTCVRKLSDKETTQEVARIIGGINISNITLQHAQEMLQEAQKLKMRM